MVNPDLSAISLNYEACFVFAIGLESKYSLRLNHRASVRWILEVWDLQFCGSWGFRIRSSWHPSTLCSDEMLWLQRRSTESGLMLVNELWCLKSLLQHTQWTVPSPVCELKLPQLVSWFTTFTMVACSMAPKERSSVDHYFSISVESGLFSSGSRDWWMVTWPVLVSGYSISGLSGSVSSSWEFFQLVEV